MNTKTDKIKKLSKTLLFPSSALNDLVNFLNACYFQYMTVVLSRESVVDRILMKQFHTLSPMYGRFFCKVVSLSLGKIK